LSQNAKKPADVVAGFSKQRTDLDGQDEIKNATANVLSIASSKSISWTWRGANFVRIAPGSYSAICSRWKGPDWIPAYRRYGFRLMFQLLSEEVDVTMFINFGNKPQPPSSVASKYFQAWTIVNGEPPLRGQPMAPSVFIEGGLLYTVEVEDAKIDPKTKKDKPPCLIYSRVTEILSVTRP
jgi:hypothetical protein